MKVWVILLLLVVSFGSSLVVVNSLDGRDVVSGVYYGAIVGEEVQFVPPDYLEDVVYGKIGWNGDIVLVQSEGYPIIVGMKNTLENKGNYVTLISSSDPYETNLKFAESSNARSFVLVDPVYGYNTVSVLPYAKEKGMYLLFVDKELSGEVVEFLKGKNPEEVLVYGYVDEEVKLALGEAGVSYSEMNNGDKFLDNMEVVDAYFGLRPEKEQIILSDGNAFEDTIIAADDPVVLISPVISPDVYNYVEGKVEEGQVSVALVVDSEYAQTAYDLKTSINNELGEDSLAVLVKFGQSVPSIGSGMLPVDLFPLRGPILGLEITKAEYNTASGMLEITYGNTGNSPEYVKSQIDVYVDGAKAGAIGDEEPFQLDRGETLGKGYALEVEEGEIVIEITALYGSSKRSMENGIQVTLNAGRVAYTDDSLMNISAFMQDAETGDVFITYDNVGAESVYFKPDATVEIGGKSTKIKSDTLYQLGVGEAEMVKFPGILGSAEGGVEVVAGADYGSREAFMEKRIEGSHVFTVEAPVEEAEFDMNLLFILLILVLVVVILYLVLGRKKEEPKKRKN
ncbi:MAG: hypothetical protein GY852_09590 [bacterium]|nr:hypothetical protein [bacterium]